MTAEVYPQPLHATQVGLPKKIHLVRAIGPRFHLGHVRERQRTEELVPARAKVGIHWGIEDSVSHHETVRAACANSWKRTGAERSQIYEGGVAGAKREEILAADSMIAVVSLSDELPGNRFERDGMRTFHLLASSQVVRQSGPSLIDYPIMPKDHFLPHISRMPSESNSFAELVPQLSSVTTAVRVYPFLRGCDQNVKLLRVTEPVHNTVGFRAPQLLSVAGVESSEEAARNRRSWPSPASSLERREVELASIPTEDLLIAHRDEGKAAVRLDLPQNLAAVSI